MLKILVMVFVFFCSDLLYATSTTLIKNNCLVLGSNPSLIVKFKHFSSKIQPNLSPKFVKNFSSDLAYFAKAEAMSRGAFVFYFRPTELMQKHQVIPGCYTKFIVNDLISDLKTKAEFEYIDPNVLLEAATLAVPAISAKQWNLLSPPGGIDVSTAFAITTGKANAITAVLDTGILTNNSLTPNQLTGVTFNNNQAFVGAAPSCDSSCANYDHGTHVAGIVSASGTLAYGESIYGVAPTAKILPINVFSKLSNSSDCCGNPVCVKAFIADLVNAINWINGETFTGLPSPPYVATLNMSLGCETACPTSLQSALNNSIAKNISVAVAAGNNNDDASKVMPANCTGVMAVAATTKEGFGASYSNYGSIISFAAPGVEDTGNNADKVYSTLENGYGYAIGTSMASPHAAGLAALLYSIDPTLTPTDVLNYMKNTATAFPSGVLADSCTTAKPCGAGIINAGKAVLVAAANAPFIQWTPNLNLVIKSANKAVVSWQTANWKPARSTPIVYTVNLNGADVANCTNLSSTSCTLTNVNLSTIYSLYVKASDPRNIYGPTISPTITFTMGCGLTSTCLTQVQSVPFYNIKLKPNCVIPATYSFTDKMGIHPIIFCYENTTQTIAEISWTYQNQCVVPQPLPVSLKYKGPIDKKNQEALADTSGILGVKNTKNFDLIVSCVYAF